MFAAAKRQAVCKDHRIMLEMPLLENLELDMSFMGAEVVPQLIVCFDEPTAAAIKNISVDNNVDE